MPHKYSIYHKLYIIASTIQNVIRGKVTNVEKEQHNKIRQEVRWANNTSLKMVKTINLLIGILNANVFCVVIPCIDEI